MITTMPTTTPDGEPTVDSDRLMAFVFRAVGEIGATLNTALVVMGDRLGYYRALAGAGPTTPAELAERTATDAHYTREWLNAQAAGGFVDYDPTTGGYTLPPEHAVALADESSPAFLPGFFQLAHGAVTPPPTSSTPPAPAPAGAGTSTPPTYTWAASGSSDPATTPTWWPNGCPHSTESPRS
jgi:hypothetical protein